MTDNETRTPVRIGILGTGAISQIVHLPILTERGDVEVGAVADLDRPKARSIAERFDVPRVLSDQELFEDPEIDALVLCTPNYLHHDQAIAALEQGKHVLVERPLALTGEGVAEVLEVAREAGGCLVVGMSHRFRPDVGALHSFVAGGELGEVYAARGAWLNRKAPMGRSTWRQDPEQSGGGALMDLGVQILDMVLWMLDFPQMDRVVAVTRTIQSEVEAGATLQATGESGITLSIEVNTAYFAEEDRHHVRLIGTEGAGSLPPLLVHKQLGGRPMDVTPRQPIPQGREHPYTNAYRRELDHFVRAIRGEADAPLPQEQVELMNLIQGAYRSAKEGREVEL